MKYNYTKYYIFLFWLKIKVRVPNLTVLKPVVTSSNKNGWHSKLLAKNIILSEFYMETNTNKH